MRSTYLQSLVVGIYCTQAGHEVLQLEVYDKTVLAAHVL